MIPTYKTMFTGLVTLFIAVYFSLLVVETKYHDVLEKTIDISDNELSTPVIEPALQSKEPQSIAALRSELLLLMQQVSDLQDGLARTRNDIENSRSDSSEIHQSHWDEERSREQKIHDVTHDSQSTAIAAFYDQLDNHIDYEAQDPTWANEAESVIYHAFKDQALLGSHVTFLDCRSTLCRAEIHHESPNDMEMFKLEFSYRVSSFLPQIGMQHDQSDDGHQTTVYLAKKGHNFAEMAN